MTGWKAPEDHLILKFQPSIDEIEMKFSSVKITFSLKDLLRVKRLRLWVQSKQVSASFHLGNKVNVNWDKFILISTENTWSIFCEIFAFDALIIVFVLFFFAHKLNIYCVVLKAESVWRFFNFEGPPIHTWSWSFHNSSSQTLQRLWLSNHECFTSEWFRSLTLLLCRFHVLVVQTLAAVQLFVEHGDESRVLLLHISSQQGAFQQATKHIQ